MGGKKKKQGEDRSQEEGARDPKEMGWSSFGDACKQLCPRTAKILVETVLYHSCVLGFSLSHQCQLN